MKGEELLYMDGKYRFVKGYKDEEALRHSFNRLAESTFGIEFENWYSWGYWTDRYIPYSIACGDRIVANVSVNRMQFDSCGTRKNYIQLGTVMTDAAHRNQGLIRYLMERISEEYEETVDGMYLFANNSVLDFYPKFGFRESREYQHSRPVRGQGERTAVSVPMESGGDRAEFLQAVEESTCQSAFGMRGNSQLIMFYAAMSMRDCVYYVESERAYVIAETEGEKLILHDLFAPEKVSLDQVIQAFGKEVKEVCLGFTPAEQEGYRMTELKEEDTTLFVKGNDLEDFWKENKRFPSLSHA